MDRENQVEASGGSPGSLSGSREGTARPERRSGPLAARIVVGAVLLVLAAVSVEARHHHARGASDAEAGQFDYYVLSLSWAPTYCLTHRDDGAECAGKGYGFVLHGLWPQYESGGYPENCVTSFDLSADAASRGRSLYPSERLMEHEWRTHGTCSGVDAASYFHAADRATAAIKIPAALEPPQSDQALTPAQILGLFRETNPRLPDDAMTAACSRGTLSEVRLCLTKELSPRSCGRDVRTNCPQAAVRLPGSR